MLCWRRQSATYRAKDQETTDDVLETCNALDAIGEPTESEKKVNNKRFVFTLYCYKNSVHKRNFET